MALVPCCREAGCGLLADMRNLRELCGGRLAGSARGTEPFHERRSQLRPEPGHESQRQMIPNRV